MAGGYHQPPRHIIVVQWNLKNTRQYLVSATLGYKPVEQIPAKTNAVESDQCKCGRGEESVDHFLFRCPRWSIFRGDIRRLAGRCWGDTSYLLGGWSGEPKDGDAAKWKPANEMVTATINFAIATGRLEDKRMTMIILLYSRLRQMTALTCLSTLYMCDVKPDPSVEPLLQ